MRKGTGAFQNHPRPAVGAKGAFVGSCVRLQCTRQVLDVLGPFEAAQQTEVQQQAPDLLSCHYSGTGLQHLKRGGGRGRPRSSCSLPIMLRGPKTDRSCCLFLPPRGPTLPACSGLTEPVAICIYAAPLLRARRLPHLSPVTVTQAALLQGQRWTCMPLARSLPRSLQLPFRFP